MRALPNYSSATLQRLVTPYDKSKNIRENIFICGSQYIKVAYIKKANLTMFNFSLKKIYQNWYSQSVPHLLVVGYPKVGNTWFGVMLRRMLVSAYGLSEKKWSFALDADVQRQYEVPRVQMSHAMPQFNTQSASQLEVRTGLAKNSRLVFLMRDPRDTLVSLYFDQSFRSQRFCGSLDAMIRDPVYGVEKLLNFYCAWDAAWCESDAQILVRYEDLHQDPLAVLKNTWTFARLAQLSTDHLREAIAFGRFENMRRIEVDCQIQQGWLRKKEDVTRAEGLKTRCGRVGQYAEYMEPATLQYVESCLNALPERFKVMAQTSSDRSLFGHRVAV